MARVLVTGGTGFIGRHLVRRLAERGDQLRCLVRSPEKARQTVGQDAPAVEYVRGDVTAPDSLAEAVAGVEVVYHLAGATLQLRKGDYQQVNAEGTRRLAEVCARQPTPPVFVYVSSLAAAGPATDDHPLTEACPPHPVSEYGRSKLAAERYLRGLAGDLPITILRPPSVFGPGDLYTLKLFRLARWGIMFVPGRQLFRLSWIDVADLVEAMILAAQHGRRLTADRDDAGVYFVALDERPNVAELTQLLAEIVGRRRLRIFHVPAALGWLGVHINNLRSRLTGRAYWLNADKIREALAGSWICDPSRAKRELGFACRSDLASGLRDASRWYREQGWL
jgi:nucleoside-diphosphate-sugar epimerase